MPEEQAYKKSKGTNGDYRHVKRAVQKCALDIVGSLPVMNSGSKYLLTFQDSLTKFSKALPIPNQKTATVAKKFVTKIVREHGILGEILTDQESNFVSELLKNVCKLVHINKIQTTASHPKSNRALERSYQTLAKYICHYVNEDQSDWDEWAPYAMFAYNTTPHTALHHSSWCMEDERRYRRR